MDEYSPSVFSRTTKKSMSPGLRPASGQGTARHQAHRPKVHVLIEFAPELDQRSPQRDVVGHLLGPAHGTEEDRIMMADVFFPIVRHHLAVPQVVVARCKVKLVELQREAILFGGGLQHAHAFGNHFAARCRRRESRRFCNDGSLAGRCQAFRAFLAWRLRRSPSRDPAQMQDRCRRY